MTTAQRTEKLPPLEKISVLAGDLDQLRQRVEGISGNQSLDDMLEVIDVVELGQQFGVSAECMRKKLRLAGGKVFKMGKKYVIRKVAFLEVLETLEGEATC